VCGQSQGKFNLSRARALELFLKEARGHDQEAFKSGFFLLKCGKNYIRRITWRRRRVFGGRSFHV